jgi:hypothetical protein
MVMSMVIPVPMTVRLIMRVAMPMPPMRMAVRMQVHHSYYKKPKHSPRASFLYGDSGGAFALSAIGLYPLHPRLTIPAISITM